ncbi:TIGR03943 family putative permease subunit [Glycomyces xiaoerkulensis]|uniref:TIGR03943 family putative permease subunit n=1 Tax=Glycomyces xiaoerkulensis TaxID=2038139 RepID=UPI0018E4C402|nr:TIGR03943 family protein [Glycomyces xiaoerkulensis]
MALSSDAQAVVLLLLGGGLIRLAATGEYLNYVKPYAFWLILPAGLVLAALAAATAWAAWRDRAEARPGCHGESPIAWLLLAPVVGMLLVAPDALGSYEAERTGTALGAEEGRSTYPELPEDADPAPLTLMDYAARAVYDDGRTLEGRRIRLRGFVVHEGGEPRLARMVVACCAADARPVKVGLEGDVPAGLEPDQWIEVVGAYTPRQGRDEVNGALVPYIEVESVAAIAAPENEYQ